MASRSGMARCRIQPLAPDAHSGRRCRLKFRPRGCAREPLRSRDVLAPSTRDAGIRYAATRGVLARPHFGSHLEGSAVETDPTQSFLATAVAALESWKLN